MSKDLYAHAPSQRHREMHTHTQTKTEKLFTWINPSNVVWTRIMKGISITQKDSKNNSKTATTSLFLPVIQVKEFWSKTIKIVYVKRTFLKKLSTQSEAINYYLVFNHDIFQRYLYLEYVNLYETRLNVTILS